MNFKMQNGSIKATDGPGDKKRFLGIFQRGYKELAHRVTNKHSGNASVHKTGIGVAQILSIVLSGIGAIVSLKWVWSFLIPSSTYPLINDHGAECLGGNLSRCPWASAFTDLGNRIKALEIAFGEQNEAREYIERGLYNQSALNSYIGGKLDVFFVQLENISQECKQLERKIGGISMRLLVDELLGFIILICILAEVYNRTKHQTQHWRDIIVEAFETKVLKKPPRSSKIPKYQHRKTESESSGLEKPEISADTESSPGSDCTDNANISSKIPVPINNNVCSSCSSQTTVTLICKPQIEEEKERRVNYIGNHSAPSTPKHGVLGVLRNEMCVVMFSRDTSGIFSSVVDTLMGFMPDIPLASNPYYIIENTGDCNKLPRVKLYMLICDGNVGYSNVVTSRDLRLAAIRYMHRLGADVVVVIGNDSESELLTGHRQYNSNLRLVFANETMQDLASSGRVFSLNREMSPHQMSHLRKTVKTLMNTKPKDTNSKPRFITITK